jgi:AcrR family transcriptional regulator
MTSAKRPPVRRPKAAQREGTQRRLVEATIELLDSTSIIELSATDITGRAGLSNAAFYAYFTDVYEVVLTAGSKVDQSSPELLSLFDEPWTSDAAPAQAAKLVECYFKVWDQHRPILRARNLAAEEGRPEFVKQRQLSMTRLIAALADQMRHSQQAGLVPAAVQPFPVANALAALLERTGAVRPEYRSSGPDWEQKYTDAVIHILLCAFGFKKGL